jgi:hypothetical protein
MAWKEGTLACRYTHPQPFPSAENYRLIPSRSALQYKYLLVIPLLVPYHTSVAFSLMSKAYLHPCMRSIFLRLTVRVAKTDAKGFVQLCSTPQYRCFSHSPYAFILTLVREVKSLTKLYMRRLLFPLTTRFRIFIVAPLRESRHYKVCEICCTKQDYYS